MGGADETERFNFAAGGENWVPSFGGLYAKLLGRF